MNATVLGHFLMNKLGIAKTSFMVFSRIAWLIFSLSLPTMLAISCDSATKAAKEVADICTKYLNLLPLAATDERSKILKEQLHLLRSMSNSVQPFSAAGFFTINHSMLGLIVGSVPPYLIFMLECLQKETINFYGNVTSSHKN
ncbi:uncharacterized protein LOC123672565 isoform X2 [Harmonia axyridis]|uniref:uncharacterized protein LOC123672565 isoform X2 n=1 Tax=Harmonia axyridis TaxID=115357 RepID=UPI001E27859A|nr:uncharacterized protein LOC123672565 isoform X2 [Harmonia axyridis]